VNSGLIDENIEGPGQNVNMKVAGHSMAMAATAERCEHLVMRATSNDDDDKLTENLTALTSCLKILSALASF
jgi:hypothetical protein